MRRRLLPYLVLSAGTAFLTLSFSSTSSTGTRSWDRKLDPFLRRIALGSEKHQGPIAENVPARSRELMRALPAFVRAERDADDPIVYVKARVAADEGGARLPEGLERRLRAL